MADQPTVETRPSIAAQKGTYRNQGTMRDMRVPFPSKRKRRTTELKDLSLLEVLELVAFGGHEGCLRVVQGDITLAIDVRASQGVAFRVEGWSEDRSVMEAILGNKATGEDAKVRIALVDAQDAGKRVALVLYERKLATLPEIVGAIRTAREKLLEHLTGKGEGSFEWTPSTAKVAADPVVLDLRPAVVRLFRSRLRRAFHRDMETFLRPLMGRYPVCSLAAARTLPGLVLDRKERMLLESGIDGARTLAEVFSISLLSRHGTSRIVYLLSGAGMMVHHPEPQAEVVRVATEEQLRQLLGELKSRSHFEILGLHWTCHPQEVEDAITDLRSRFGPSSPQHRASDETRELCEEISAFHEKAYAALRSQEGRRSCRAEEYGTARVRYAADFLVTQAELNKFKNDFVAATRLLDCARDLVDDPELKPGVAEAIRKKYR